MTEDARFCFFGETLVVLLSMAAWRSTFRVAMEIMFIDGSIVGRRGSRSWTQRVGDLGASDIRITRAHTFPRRQDGWAPRALGLDYGVFQGRVSSECP